MNADAKSIAKRLLSCGLPVPRMIRPLIRMCHAGGVRVAEALVWLRKLVFVEPVLRSVCESVGDGLRAERLPYLRGRGRLILGRDVNLSGRSSFYFMSGMPEPPLIRVGDGVFIGHGCTLSAARGIEIGDHCLIAAGVRIHDNDGHPLDADRRRRGERIGSGDVAPVILGPDVWVGAGAVILKGVTVGQGAVIGAGAVVTRDVAPATVVAGNPAVAVKALS